MLIAMIFGSTLLFLGAFFHFCILRTSALIIDPSAHPMHCFALTIVVTAIAHFITALAFAGVFHFAEFQMGLGSLSNSATEAQPPVFMDRFYFSLVNLTTLGRGDLLPTGHLRFLTALEALLGFLVITGSGAFLLQVINGKNPTAKN